MKHCLVLIILVGGVTQHSHGSSEQQKLLGFVFRNYVPALVEKMPQLVVSCHAGELCSATC